MVKENKLNRGLDDKPMELGLLSLNPPNASFLRVLKRALEEAISLVAIPLISSSSRLSTIPTFFSSFEHPQRLRILSDFIFKKLQMFTTPNAQWSKQVKYAIDMGNFVIAASSNKSFDTHSLFSPNSGILFYFWPYGKNENLKRLHFKFAWKSFEVFAAFQTKKFKFFMNSDWWMHPGKLIQFSRTNFLRLGY